MLQHEVAPTSSPHTPRGIAPHILLEQAKNTIPFVFERKDLGLTVEQRHLALLRSEPNPTEHEKYFELCLATHHATVASFVPTDVDNQIRAKLWSQAATTETLVAMAELVIESYHWDFRPVSTRWITTPSGMILTGHHGEWFSTAAAAYAALRKRAPETAGKVADMMISEVRRHAKCFSEFRKKRDGIGMLKAAPLVAHNLGDLDRVIEAWNLPEADPVRLAVYKAGHEPREGLSDDLIVAGNLNKTYTAKENHRHFALRAARSLRRSGDLLLPLGPFFDEWGATVAKHPSLNPEDVGNIAEQLVGGWERLGGECFGYARALAGIESTFSGGLNRLTQYLPSRVAKTLKAGPLRAQCAVSKARFESQWNQFALNFVK